MRHPGGQALVEFALILPIFLMLLVGGFWVGIGLIGLGNLAHAASEGATIGAAFPGPPQRCPKAIAAARAVYPRPGVSITCTASGQLVTVVAEMDLQIAIPGVDARSWHLKATERGAVR